MKALLSNFHQSPQKVRLVAKMIRGKAVPAARMTLQYAPTKSAPAMLKLLDSAVANAAQKGASAEDLVVKTVTVNKGTVLRRFMPRARGRAARYAKTMSIIAIELAANPNAVPKAAKKAAKKAKAPSEGGSASGAKKAVKKAAKPAAAKTE